MEQKVVPSRVALRQRHEFNIQIQHLNMLTYVTKNCCVTYNIRLYANFVSNLLAYLISAVSPGFVKC